jgi:hypothetical protein
VIAQWGWEKQLTKHRLLPVLIESELTEGRTLIDKIRGVLSAQTNQGILFHQNWWKNCYGVNDCW